MMRLFSRGAEIEIEDLRVGRIRIQVRENIVDRVIRVFSPARADKRLEARALALPSGESPPDQRPVRHAISRGIRVREWADREGGGAYTSEECGDYPYIVPPPDHRRR